MLSGNVSSLNQSISTLTYSPNADFNGIDTLTVDVSDSGFSGASSALYDAATVVLNVTAVNDGPVVRSSAPTVDVPEDALLFSVGTFSVSDRDAGEAPGQTLSLNASVSHGSLVVAVPGAAAVVGQNTSFVSLTGTVSGLNSALLSLQYSPSLNFNGPDSLVITVRDNGLVGAGGSLTSTDTTVLNVTSINDAPTLHAPSLLTLLEDAVKQSVGGVNVSDVDVAELSGVLHVTIAVTHGAVAVEGSAAGGLGQLLGNGTSALELSGTAAVVNAALASLTYSPNAHFNGVDLVQLQVLDGGFSGTLGGQKNATASTVLSVQAVNDAPVISGPPSFSLIEDDTNVSLAGLTVDDVDLDEDSGQLNVSLEVQHGLLHIADAAAAAAVLIASASPARHLDLTGTVVTVNLALGTLQYSPDADFFGQDAILVAANDSGASGAGGTLDDVRNITLHIAAVNDAPVVTVPPATTLAEDTIAMLAASVLDVDIAQGTMTAAVRVSRGVLRAFASLAVAAGNNTGNLTLSGSLPDVNAALGSLVYQPHVHFNGADVATFVVSDGLLNVTRSVNITVGAINDAPVLSALTLVTGMQEDAVSIALPSGGVTVRDVDVTESGGVLQVTVKVQHGTLSFPPASPATVGAETNSSFVQLTGTSGQLNTTLASLVYTPDADYNGADAAVFHVTDNAATGPGSALNDTLVIAISVLAVNDPITLDVTPVSLVFAEDVRFGAIPNVTVSDVDALESPSGSVRAVLSVASGTLTVNGNGLAISGNGTSSLVLDARFDDLASALATLTYTGAPDFHGADVLTLHVTDQGNTGSGPAYNSSATVAINVTSVNDAPRLSAPLPLSFFEESPPVDVTGFGIEDVDGDAVNVTLQADHGTITLASTTGLTFELGASNGGKTVAFHALVADASDAVSLLRFDSDVDFSGHDNVTMTVNDLGSAGVGGPQESVAVAQLEVQAFNDVPGIFVARNVETVDEDTLLNVSSIEVRDPDGADQVVLNLSVTNGVLLLAPNSTTGLHFEAGASGQRALSFRGDTVAALNVALAGLSYLPDSNFFGPDTLLLSTTDNGATGFGGVQTDTSFVVIDVVSVNDAPVLTVSASIVFATEDGSASVGLAVSDVDAPLASPAMSFTVNCANGTATVTGTGSPALAELSGQGTSVVTATGSEAAINAALASVVFAPDADFNGNASLAVTVSDLGNSGSGGALDDTAVVTVVVSPVNDPPVVVAPPTVTTLEDTAVLVTATLEDDAEETSDHVLLSVAVDHGSLQFVGEGGAAVAGAVVTRSAGNRTLNATGTVPATRALAAQLRYVPDLDYYGADELRVSLNDQASHGAGAALSASATTSITVTSVNDAPMVTVASATVAVTEDGSVAVSGTVLVDVDSDDNGGHVRVACNVLQGKLVLGAAGGSATSVAGNGTTTVSLQGPVGEVAAAIASMTYTPIPDFNGVDSLTIAAEDLGNSGVNSTNLQAQVVVTLVVAAINDGPTVMATTPLLSVPEDGSVNVTGVSVADVDVSETLFGTLRVTVTATEGLLEVSDSTGGAVTVVALSANTTELDGAADPVNAALATLRYTPTPNFNGQTNITVVVNDTGNTGLGGALTAVVVVTVEVIAISDRPIITLPFASAAINEDEPLSNVVVTVIDDAVQTSSAVDVSIDAPDTSITLASLAGLTFLNGTAQNTSLIRVRGTIPDINAALGGFAVLPDLHFFGSTVLNITVDDLGHTGGLRHVVASALAINVTAVNDPPVLGGLNASATTLEDTVLVLAGLSVTDADAQSNLMVAVLNVSSGSLSLLGSTGGLALYTGDGTASLIASGSQVELSLALASISYLPSLHYNGADTLTVSVSDRGAAGDGGEQMATLQVAIAVSAVNDAPVLGLPGQQRTLVDTPVTFGGLVFADVELSEVTSLEGRVTLNGSFGTVQLAEPGASARVVAGANDTETVTVQGTLVQLSAVLATLRFVPQANYGGFGVVHVELSDLGNTGAGGPKAAAGTVPVFVDNPAVTLLTCANSPCFFGNCTDTPGGFTCACFPGYNGTLCDNFVNAGVECVSDATCESHVCEAGKCAAPLCTDRVHNGAETDIDCGGNVCVSPCLEGKACVVDSDCVSNICEAGTCTRAEKGAFRINGANFATLSGTPSAQSTLQVAIEDALSAAGIDVSALGGLAFTPTADGSGIDVTFEGSSDFVSGVNNAVLASEVQIAVGGEMLTPTTDASRDGATEEASDGFATSDAGIALWALLGVLGAGAIVVALRRPGAKDAVGPAPRTTTNPVYSDEFGFAELNGPSRWFDDPHDKGFEPAVLDGAGGAGGAGGVENAGDWWNSPEDNLAGPTVNEPMQQYPV